LKRILASLALGLSLIAPAVSAAPISINDGTHTVTIADTPKRIVVLEFSFADALAAVAVSPVGVADDKDAKRLPQAVRDIIGSWTSVGTRGQPSIEAVAGLKPDLIIADLDRHASVYKELSAIAPTLLLSSRGEDYQGSLKSAALIAQAVGKTPEMEARLATHRDLMAKIAAEMPKGVSILFGAAREDSFSVHGPDSYAGSVLLSLGATVPSMRDKAAPTEFAGIEQLLSLDPEWLFVGNYRHPNIVDKWSKEELWSVLRASKGKVVSVDSNVWARNRGILSAEKIAADTLAILQGKFTPVE
jgi:iron complex transport system substrate-binding protein